MRRKLYFYPNCSKGGMTSVLRGRAVNEPNTVFDFVSYRDLGGREAFDDVPNVNVRIVPKTRLIKYLNYVMTQFTYQEISLCFGSEIFDELKVPAGTKIFYEFHSSNLTLAAKELNAFDTQKPEAFRVPSVSLAADIAQIAPQHVVSKLRIEPNLLDSRYFYKSSSVTPDKKDAGIPLYWIGRLDIGKGIEFFLRTLALLPSHFHGHVILSHERAVEPFAELISEATIYGLQDRLKIYQDIPPKLIGDMFREGAADNGFFVSTSLRESFGYALHEAEACGLKAVAFDLPVISEHPRVRHNTRTVNLGDVYALAAAIEDATASNQVDSQQNVLYG